jgi:hypothetical protein
MMIIKNIQIDKHSNFCDGNFSIILIISMCIIIYGMCLGEKGSRRIVMAIKKLSTIQCDTEHEKYEKKDMTNHKNGKKI